MPGEANLHEQILAADKTAKPWDLLVASDGVTPVWPAPFEDDRASIEEVTQMFGGRPAWVDGRAAHAVALKPEIVTAIGAGADSAGRLYAHLTGRTFVSARDATDAFANTRPTVIVVTQLTADLVQMAGVAIDGSAVTGIIWSPSPEGLRRQVLVRAAASRLCGPVEIRRIDLRPLSPGMPTAVAPDHLILRDGSDNDEVYAGLSAGAGLLSVLSHSDGIDALGGPVTICVQKGHTAGSSTGHPPRCELTRYCHRIDMPIRDALQTPKLVPPESVRARVLIWHTCLGVTTTDWMVDPTWSLGGRLADSASIGALITTWSIGPMAAKETDYLSELAASGHRVGDALRAHAKRWSPSATMRLCLFGDPLVRATVNADSKIVAASAAHRTSVDPCADGLTPLVSAAKLLVADHDTPTIATALANIRLGVGREDAALHGAVVDEISRSSWNGWLACWTKVARIIKREDRECKRCGGLEDSFVGVLDGRIKRRFSACYSCNTLADRPIGVRADVAVSHTGTARLAYWRPKAAWAGKLTVFTTVPGQRVSWAWPRNSRGQPVREFQSDWPMGPLRVLGVFADEDGPVAVTRFLWHRDSGTGENKLLIPTASEANRN